MRVGPVAWTVLAALSLTACNKTSPDPEGDTKVGPATASVQKPSSPEEAVHEQLRAGRFQLEGSLDSIEAALNAAKALDKEAKGETKETLDDVVDRINSVGDVLANQKVETPSLAEVKKNFGTQDDARLKAIDDVNDSLTELRETQKIIDALAESAPDPKAYDDLSALLDTAIEDTHGTLEAFGGKEVAPDTSETMPTTAGH